jgi:hypothetical protein
MSIPAYKMRAVLFQFPYATFAKYQYANEKAAASS